jgi:hypothetical protein
VEFCSLRSLTLFAIQNPHPLKNAKGAAPKIKNESKSKKALIVEVWVAQ